MRCNIHFPDNSKINKKGVRGYDPLFKFRYQLKIIIEGIRGVWTSGKHVNIGNIMIRYMGRAITYVQYMPAKPINHGIKLFAICCDISTIILGLKVYVVQEGDSYNTDLEICDEMVKEAGLTSTRGRTLYTNNYYI